MHITVLPGRDRDGNPETFERIEIRPGETISIVGPTGSGKSAFINDIEIFAANDTSTGRTVLVNGRQPPEEYVRDPARKPVALITQNTRCLADMRVGKFLEMHIRARGITEPGIVQKTTELANEFTGEKILPEMRMTALSGGQTRSLMVADAIIISNAPLILLDEVENAGIFKDKVISCLRAYRKALIFVTHDPVVSLLSGQRIVMGNGGVRKVLKPAGQEADALRMVMEMDSALSRMRERIRAGEMITPLGQAQ